MTGAPLKVLHVVPSYFPATYWGGPIFTVHALNTALAAQHGVELRVLTTDTAGPRWGDRVRVDKPHDLYNHEVQFTSRVAATSIAPGLMLRLRAAVQWADIVHLTATYSFPTLPTITMCRLLDKPLVWSPRGGILEAQREGTRKRALKRMWDRLCDGLAVSDQVMVHVTSERERQACVRQLPGLRTRLIENGVDIPPLRPRTWQPQGITRLMYLGRLSPEKGIEPLIDTVALCDHRVQLTIYGTGTDGYASQLRARAAARGLLGRRLTFAGAIHGDAKEEAFSQADLCIVPSHSESFGMVVAESLASGVPVIASRGTPWNSLVSARCGEWVDNTPPSLRDAIDRMRSTDLEATGARGRSWMQRDYAWSTIADKMRALYEDLR